MAIEINTDDIAKFLGHDNATLADLERYVQTQIPENQRVNPQPQLSPQPTRQANTFTLTQSEYIDYLIDKRESQKRSARRSLFWSKMGHSVTWLLKVCLSVIVFLFFCWGFYLLVWFMQNSLYFYWVNRPSIP